jgi:(p)ppGpp synthase/HD superfamily hydrolase
VANLIVPLEQTPQSLQQRAPTLPLEVGAQKGSLLQYARCCHPIPGDPILGHLSPGKGVVVHLESCRNLSELRSQPEKCTPMTWSSKVHGQFPVELKVEITPERGFIAVLASRITEKDATIEKVSTLDKDAYTSVVDLVIAVRDRIHLADILRRVRGLPAVRRVSRVRN